MLLMYDNIIGSIFRIIIKVVPLIIAYLIFFSVYLKKGYKNKIILTMVLTIIYIIYEIIFFKKVDSLYVLGELDKIFFWANIDDKFKIVLLLVFIGSTLKILLMKNKDKESIFVMISLWIVVVYYFVILQIITPTMAEVYSPPTIWDIFKDRMLISFLAIINLVNCISFKKNINNIPLKEGE